MKNIMISKKLLLTFLFIYIYTFSYAETKITISGKLEVGTGVEERLAFFDTNLSLNLYFWKFKNSLSAGSRTWFDYYERGTVSAYPFREIYYYEDKLSICGVFIKYNHFCNHPVRSTAIHGHYNDIRWLSNTWGETMTTISIGYEFEFPVWKK